MIDRASILADKSLVAWVKKHTVPVAIDQAYQRRQKDTEGQFYRSILKGSPKANSKGTTQGFYLASPDGRCLGYNNNRTADKLMAMLSTAYAKHEKRAVAKVTVGNIDPRYNPKPPKGGLVVRVRSKVLDGYEPTTDRWKLMTHSATSRDNLWITEIEKEALIKGKVLDSLALRIARFHLVDSTRGEPPMWKVEEVKNIKLEIADGIIKGKAHLVSEDGKRGYSCEISGKIIITNDMLQDMKLVALGSFYGEGRYTKGAPKGKFPLLVGFQLADGKDIADAIPPQGSRGWVKGYIGQ